MPDTITHYIFGLDTAQNIKNSPLYPCLKENKELFLIGLQGPDPIYYHHLRKKDNKASLATKMHMEKTSDFLISALCQIKRYDISSREFYKGLSYLSGFICHYILDYMAHPYIFYLGGRYLEDAPETHKYIGFHKKIELAIDTILCEERFSLKSSEFKIHKHILKDIKFPESLISMFDETIFLNYGITDGGQTFKEAYKNTRTYYKLTYDRFGAKKALASLLPFAHSFSYYNCLTPDFDYMNRNKRVWLHPITGNVYTFSFYDILRNANKKSTALLQAAYDFATSHITADEFRALLPNVSYLTGLPVEDTRPFKYISNEYLNL